MMRLVLAGVLSINLCACSIFETRDSESPTQARSTFTPPTDPSMVLTNMVNAVREGNTVNYLRCLSDSLNGGRVFQFEPTATSRLQFAGVFAGWNKMNEQQSFEIMKSKLRAGASMTLTLLSANVVSVQPDSAQYEVTYHLNVPHSVASLSTDAQGKAQFWLVAGSSRFWYINRWIDISLNSSDVTWSDFKGSFSQ